MVSATIIYYSKIFVSHDERESEVVIELKVWEVPVSEKYSEGLKYSLYCVDVDTKVVVLGIDNHHPKVENVEKLIEDFYSLVRARGYKL